MDKEEYKKWIEGMARVEIAIEEVLGKMRKDVEAMKEKLIKEANK